MNSLNTETSRPMSSNIFFSSNFTQNGRTFRIAAATLVIIYICVQAFQNYVFGAFGTPASAGEELLQGAANLHIIRSSLMLISIFALIFMWWVICAQGLRRNSFLALIAFFGFFMFGMFEVALRSVELFWTQIQLPAEYLKATDPLVRAAILDKFATFQSIQGALYFPLMFGPFLAYFAVYFLFPSSQRIHWALKFSVAFAAARTGLRLLGYAGIHLVSDATYAQYYFAMVLIEYLPRAYWLFRVKDEQF
ncbi:MAG: hypothetical protein M1391_13525 [Bacteroidetes bacterium]|nr:hypothetical protein [Bacteroidota bacterium]